MGKKMLRTRRRPVGEISSEDQIELEALSQSSAAPYAWVERAKAIVLVQHGYSYAETGRRIGRKNGDGVSALVKRFNAEGLAAIIPRHGGRPQPKYTSAQRARIVTEMGRQPTAEADGTNSWSLVMLQKALRAAADGLPEVSTETISRVVHEAGYSWQANRTWCQTGAVRRMRKKGPVTVTDPDANAKKK